METNSSGEELVIKTRKPYTITKQRERWTDEEHNRFLEALKLYGRAWQNIEEHVGTKTAVQIRSHAQKFFSKMEKEAQAKGIPVGQALDIDIPPPRPKKKPSNPYPRKTGNISPMSQAVGKDGKLALSASLLKCKEALVSEKGSLSENHNEERQSSNLEDNQEDDRSDCFTHSRSASSMNKSSAETMALANGCTFREFLPPPKEASHDNGTRKASNSEKYCNLHAKSVQGLVKNGVNSISPVDEEGPHTYPRFVPMHIPEGSSIICATSPPPTVPNGIHGCSNKFIDPSASVARSEHDSDVARSTPCALPAFHLAAAPVPHTPDDFRPFANLIMSTLLQNPAVHAAATFAASYWPHSPCGSSTCTEVGFPPGQMNSPPSLAAVAAATVAAATAWWAAHGLLPLCAPFHSAFPCHPPPTNVAPSDDNGHAPSAKLDTKESTLRNPSVQSQEVDPEHSEASKAQSSSSKTTSSPSYSKESEATKTGTGAKHEKPADETDQKGSNGAKDRTQVDRSSCGSNTPSSSDVEADASENLEKCKDEVKEVEADANLASESNTRRSRSSNNLSEPWKSVSEEGRLAFQALFSREVLPQSFSPPNDSTNKRNQTGNKDEENKKSTETGHGESLALDLNSNVEATDAEHRGEKGDCLRSSENREEEGFLGIGLAASKLKGRMGFKPYKRCAVEAKENRIISTNPLDQAEQKDPKRIRLESEAST